jgi:acyl-coenzyme A thioesterase PaaI-like protein
MTAPIKRLYESRFDEKEHRTTGLEHRYCFACGTENPDGLALEFSLSEDGGIVAFFKPKKAYQGYDGLLHGGIVCTLLDSAMTRLLMEKGISAMTADLNVRFKKSIPIAEVLVVRARIENRRRHLFQLSADLEVNGSVGATATGKFLEIKEVQ